MRANRPSILRFPDAYSKNLQQVPLAPFSQANEPQIIISGKAEGKMLATVPVRAIVL